MSCTCGGDTGRGSDGNNRNKSVLAGMTEIINDINHGDMN